MRNDRHLTVDEICAELDIAVHFYEYERWLDSHEEAA